MIRETMIGWMEDFIKAHRKTDNCMCDIHEKYEAYMALTERFNELFPDLEGATVLGQPVKDVIEEYCCGCDFKDTNIKVKSLGIAFDDIPTFLTIVEALVKMPETEEPEVTE